MLLKYQYNYSVINCFFPIIEKLKELFNRGKDFGIILTDLYEELRFLHKYSIATLQNCKLNKVSLKKHIYLYLINKK